MIIDPERRFVFIHIQKTGGLTVSDYLRSVSPSAQDVRCKRGGVTRY